MRPRTLWASQPPAVCATAAATPVPPCCRMCRTTCRLCSSGGHRPSTTPAPSAASVTCHWTRRRRTAATPLPAAGPPWTAPRRPTSLSRWCPGATRWLTLRRPPVPPPAAAAALPSRRQPASGLFPTFRRCLATVAVALLHRRKISTGLAAARTRARRPCSESRAQRARKENTTCCMALSETTGGCGSAPLAHAGFSSSRVCWAVGSSATALRTPASSGRCHRRPCRPHRRALARDAVAMVHPASQAAVTTPTARSGRARCSSRSLRRRRQRLLRRRRPPAQLAVRPLPSGRRCRRTGPMKPRMMPTFSPTASSLMRRSRTASTCWSVPAFPRFRKEGRMTRTPSPMAARPSSRCRRRPCSRASVRQVGTWPSARPTSAPW
mmetsp:Transcript_96869/g.278751  ORF Transcript_96869/g.278751 Transcript_96869/m.278751 type:complete len:381 (-) Transcript_96869:473-1615(-)